jgi:transcriptional regulator GlxA family with amidase domain
MDITGNTNHLIREKLFNLLQLEGLARWMKLVEILNILADSTGYELISSQPIQGRHEKDSDRLTKAVEWVMQSFHETIKLEDVADAVKMSAPSFSRYFKHRTRKTFSAFVTEIRLGHAARLLQEDQQTVAEICYRCGFNNLSNFNRLFRKFYRMNPMEYKRQYR